MTERSARHATFVLERSYDASPARVFAQWASQEAKSRWFAASGEGDYVLDFRVRGTESNRGGPPGGPVYSYDARYEEIVADARIVYTYVMDADATRISVSLTTVEFRRDGKGTKLVLTEQGVFLDGGDAPEICERGTGEIIDKLADVLSHETSL